MKQLAQFAVILVAAVAPSPAYAQSKPAVALEGAVTKEQVDGDLVSAMAAYQKIAADPAAPREVRSKALLHLAACYEKLSKPAQSVYQRIVREFGDQPAAVQARARLAVLRQGQPAVPATMTMRKIEIPGGSFPAQASDGRRMVYRNDATGEIIFSDVATKTSRVIFKAKTGDLPEWMPSRDFSMVALQFKKKPDRPSFIALIQIDGKGYRELIRDDQQGTIFGDSGGMMNWSWDNRYLLVNHLPVTGTRRVLVISTSSGERSQLMTHEDGYFEECAFSPDGRFVACKLSPYLGSPTTSRIFVLPAQGGPPRLVREQADPYLKLLDWTDDGRYLAISSAHTGRSALHLLPVKDGQAAGEPILIQTGLYEGAFTTKTGTLVYLKAKPGGLWTIHVASLDPDGRPGTWQRLERPGENQTNPWPNWSPDSTQIVYTARDMDSEFGNAVVRVRNLATGKDREIYRTPGHILCVWGHQRIFCSQWRETTALLSIVPDSGQVERIGSLPTPAALLYSLSSDEHAMHLLRIGKQKVTTARWEIATGQETVLEESEGIRTLIMASPDDRWLVRVDGHHIDARPATGGDWKTLASTTNFQYAVTRDGNWVLYHGVDSAGNHGLYRVPTTGGVPEHLGNVPSHSSLGSMEISPDGHQVVSASYDYDHGFELWALDNIVPAAPKQ